MSVWGIVVAAGTGSRFGGPKQFEALGGRRLIDWSVDAAWSVCAGVVVVLPPGVRADLAAGLSAEGGATRSASVRAGLAVVPSHATVIVIHDAARPLATAALFEAVLEAVRTGADAAIPGVALTDTVKRVRDGQVVETLDRSELVAVQTPQAFRAEALRAAHVDGGEATDDAALVEAAGGKVVVVPGDPGNVKVTRPEDLALVRAAVAERHG
jgi:2-C-methyl-D-erythritol 4-phosphate cytidylyltransferase